VVEPDGSRRSDVNGEILGILWVGERTLRNRMTITDGTWSLRAEQLRDLRRIKFEGVEIDSRLASVIEPDGILEPPFSSEVTLLARLHHPPTLRVVDAASGRDLHEVTLVRASRPNEEDCHPGSEYDDRVVARGCESPITLDTVRLASALGGPVRLLVGAPSRAWRQIVIDLRAGGERLVTLEQGANVAIRVNGVTPNSNTYLRLLSEDSEVQCVQVPLERDGIIELEGIAPGAYRAVAGIGFHAKATVPLGEAALVLTAGPRRSIELSLIAPPAPRHEDTSGVVYVPRAWEANEVTIWIHRLDPWIDSHALQQRPYVRNHREATQRVDFDAFRWTCEDLPVGHYQVGVLEPRHSMTIQVVEGSRNDFELTVPQPVELLVHVVDDVTGEPLPVEALLWQLTAPEGLAPGQIERASLLGPGEFLIRAPGAEIQFVVGLWESHSPDRDRIDLSHEVREHTLRARQSCGFDLVMLDGDAPIGFPDGWQGDLAPMPGGGRMLHQQPVGLWRSHLAWRVIVSGAGVYAMDMPKVAGYEPVPRQTIVVRAGSFTEHVVQLVRKR
jgi:hypothetical protein